MNNEYLRGFFNGLLVFFFGYNLITGGFLIFDGIKATAVSKTYAIIENQFSIVGFGILFLMCAVVEIIAYFRRDRMAPVLMMLSAFFCFFLMVYYGFTLLSVEPMTAIAYRYLYIAVVHFAMVIGGASILWKRRMRNQSRKNS